MDTVARSADLYNKQVAWQGASSESQFLSNLQKEGEYRKLLNLQLQRGFSTPQAAYSWRQQELNQSLLWNRAQTLGLATPDAYLQYLSNLRAAQQLENAGWASRAVLLKQATDAQLGYVNSLQGTHLSIGQLAGSAAQAQAALSTIGSRVATPTVSLADDQMQLDAATDIGIIGTLGSMVATPKADLDSSGFVTGITAIRDAMAALMTKRMALTVLPVAGDATQSALTGGTNAGAGPPAAEVAASSYVQKVIDAADTFDYAAVRAANAAKQLDNADAIAAAGANRLADSFLNAGLSADDATAKLALMARASQDAASKALYTAAAVEVQRRALEALSTVDAVPTIGLDTTPFQAGAAIVLAELKMLASAERLAIEAPGITRFTASMSQRIFAPPRGMSAITAGQDPLAITAAQASAASAAALTEAQAAKFAADAQVTEANRAADAAMLAAGESYAAWEAAGRATAAAWDAPFSEITVKAALAAAAMQSIADGEAQAAIGFMGEQVAAADMAADAQVRAAARVGAAWAAADAESRYKPMLAIESGSQPSFATSTEGTTYATAAFDALTASERHFTSAARDSSTASKANAAAMDAEAASAARDAAAFDAAAKAVRDESMAEGVAAAREKLIDDAAAADQAEADAKAAAALDMSARRKIAAYATTAAAAKASADAEVAAAAKAAAAAGAGGPGWGIAALTGAAGGRRGFWGAWANDITLFGGAFDKTNVKFLSSMKVWALGLHTLMDFFIVLIPAIIGASVALGAFAVAAEPAALDVIAHFTGMHTALDALGTGMDNLGTSHIGFLSTKMGTLNATMKPMPDSIRSIQAAMAPTVVGIYGAAIDALGGSGKVLQELGSIAQKTGTYIEDMILKISADVKSHQGDIGSLVSTFSNDMHIMGSIADYILKIFTEFMQGGQITHVSELIFEGLAYALSLVAKALNVIGPYGMAVVIAFTSLVHYGGMLETVLFNVYRNLVDLASKIPVVGNAITAGTAAINANKAATEALSTAQAASEEAQAALAAAYERQALAVESLSILEADATTSAEVLALAQNELAIANDVAATAEARDAIAAGSLAGASDAAAGSTAGLRGALASLATLSAGAFLAIAAAIAGIGFAIYSAGQASSQTKALVSGWQAALASDNASQGLTQIQTNLASINNYLVSTQATSRNFVGNMAQGFADLGKQSTGLLGMFKATWEMISGTNQQPGSTAMVLKEQTAEQKDWTNTITAASYATKQYGTTSAESFAIMDLAGVKVTDSLAVQKGKVDALVTGWTNMGVAGYQVGKSMNQLGNAIDAVSLQSELTNSQLTTLTGDYTSFVTLVTGGQTAFDTFAQSILTIGTNAGTAGASMTGINAASLTLRSSWEANVSAGQALYNQLMLQNAAAGNNAKSNKELAKSGQDIVSVLLAQGGASQESVNGAYAIAQTMGYTGKATYDALEKWSGGNKDVTKTSKDLNTQVGLLQTAASDLQTDVTNLAAAVSTNLTNAIAQGLIGMPTMTKTVANLSQFVLTSQAQIKAGIITPREVSLSDAFANALVSVYGTTPQGLAAAKAEFLATLSQEGISRANALSLWAKDRAPAVALKTTVEVTAAPVTPAARNLLGLIDAPHGQARPVNATLNLNTGAATSAYRNLNALITKPATPGWAAQAQSQLSALGHWFSSTLPRAAKSGWDTVWSGTQHDFIDKLVDFFSGSAPTDLKGMLKVVDESFVTAWHTVYSGFQNDVADKVFDFFNGGSKDSLPGALRSMGTTIGGVFKGLWGSIWDNFFFKIYNFFQTLPAKITRAFESGISGIKLPGGGVLHDIGSALGIHIATGGSVPGDGEGDNVPALLTPGEFVIRKPARKKLEQQFGPDFMHKLNKADQVQHLASGGPVGTTLAGAINALSTTFAGDVVTMQNEWAKATTIMGTEVVSGIETPLNNLLANLLTGWLSGSGKQWQKLWASVWSAFSQQVGTQLQAFLQTTLTGQLTQAGSAWKSTWTTAWGNFNTGIVTNLTKLFSTQFPSWFTTLGTQWKSLWTTGYSDFQTAIQTPISDWFTKSLPSAIEGAFRLSMDAVISGPIDGIVSWINSISSTAGIAKISGPASFAAGGSPFASVAGAGEQDSVHAMLMPGEYVLRKPARAALEQTYGAGFMDTLNQADTWLGGGSRGIRASQGYAAGGPITTAGQFNAAWSGHAAGMPQAGTSWTGNIGDVASIVLKEATDKSIAKAALGASVPIPADVSAYQKYAASLFPKFGWSVPGELGALIQLWNRESGWNPRAQNPTSTAYGIPQFLNTTWGIYGGTGKTSDPSLQIQDGEMYVHGKYGTPSHANQVDKGGSYAAGGDVGYPPGLMGRYASGGSATANNMLSFFNSKLGHPYSQDVNLRLGPQYYDCSGLMYRAAQAAGIPIPVSDSVASLELDWFADRSGNSLIDSQGSVRRGDLLFMTGASPRSTPYGGIGHTGMALSENEMISALGTAYGVTDSPIYNFVKGIRLPSSGSAGDSKKKKKITIDPHLLSEKDKKYPGPGPWGHVINTARETQITEENKWRILFAKIATANANKKLPPDEQNWLRGLEHTQAQEESIVAKTLAEAQKWNSHLSEVSEAPGPMDRLFRAASSNVASYDKHLLENPTTTVGTGKKRHKIAAGWRALGAIDPYAYQDLEQSVKGMEVPLASLASMWGMLRYPAEPGPGHLPAHKFKDPAVHLPGMARVPPASYSMGGLIDQLAIVPHMAAGGDWGYGMPDLSRVKPVVAPSVRSAAAQQTSGPGTGGTNVSFGDVIVNNPVGKSAPASITQGVQKAAWLAGRTL